MSLIPLSSLSQPTRRQKSFENAERLCAGEAAIERAQQRYLPGGEVAPIVTALDLGAHRGAIRARLCFSLIDRSSHGDRFSGARVPFPAHS